MVHYSCLNDKDLTVCKFAVSSRVTYVHHAHIQCTTEALSEVLQPDSRQQYGVKQPLTPPLVASVLVVYPYCVLATPLAARYRICQTTPEVSAAWDNRVPCLIFTVRSIISSYRSTTVQTLYNITYTPLL